MDKSKGKTATLKDAEWEKKDVGTVPVPKTPPKEDPGHGGLPPAVEPSDKEE